MRVEQRASEHSRARQRGFHRQSRNVEQFSRQLPRPVSHRPTPRFSSSPRRPAGSSIVQRSPRRFLLAPAQSHQLVQHDTPCGPGLPLVSTPHSSSTSPSSTLRFQVDRDRARGCWVLPERRIRVGTEGKECWKRWRCERRVERCGRREDKGTAGGEPGFRMEMGLGAHFLAEVRGLVRRAAGTLKGVRSRSCVAVSGFPKSPSDLR